VLIALLGLALCAAAFLATRSANDTGGAVTSSPRTVVPTPPVKHPVKPPAAPAHKPATHAVKPAVKPHAPTKPQAPAKPAVSPEVAKVLPAIKALARGDVVVFFFTQPGPADDTGTRQAVKSLAHAKGVSTFTVGLGDLSTYRPVLSGAGVSQVPAVVVVRAGKKARLLQGFVDASTLRQTVADARR
jgi:type IV secretory pathway VirB10-like protein